MKNFSRLDSSGGCSIVFPPLRRLWTLFPALASHQQKEEIFTQLSLPSSSRGKLDLFKLVKSNFAAGSSFLFRQRVKRLTINGKRATSPCVM